MNEPAIDKKFVRSIRNTVMRWYARHGRSFLWRCDSPDPYIVLVSEMMLQQTQTSRVQQKLPEFLAQFPTLRSLAKASNAAVILAWRGMGYNARALRLRDCARHIVTHYSGFIPDEYQKLKALPGIGEYTASAILSFAYGKDVPVLDVNIKRVYSRLTDRMKSTADVVPHSQLLSIAESLYSRGRSSEWHQAIMDIGALYCTRKKPRCEECPLLSLCRSAKRMKQKASSKRAEPEYLGKPHRIWRGRIIELLRNTENHSITVIRLRQKLSAGTEHSIDADWLQTLLENLCSDKMIERSGNRIHLAR